MDGVNEGIRIIITNLIIVCLQVIECRNDLMHSGDIQMEDEWMTEFQISVKNLVQQFSNAVPQMETAGRQIDEVSLFHLRVCCSHMRGNNLNVCLFLDQILSIDLSIWLSDGNRMNSVVFKGKKPDSVNRWDFIRQWEAELLLDVLKELMPDDNDTKTQV